MLRFEGVRKSLGGGEIIRGVDLAITAGRTSVIIGPSGCGKSTLLRLLLRLLVPDGGRVLFDGEPLTAETERAVRHRTGYVIQDGGLFPHMTARTNVTLLANLNNYPALEHTECWGYTAGGREYALLGVLAGTSIIDITDHDNPVEVAFIASADVRLKDIKTYQTYAYVTTDGGGDGIQIIDLSDLPSESTSSRTA